MTQSGEHQYPFFTHTQCAYFPCHKGIAPEDFNCLFCYCPLYALGEDCGGIFRYTEKGHKDCTACTLPHEGDTGTLHVKKHYPKLAALAARKPGKDLRDNGF